MSVTLQVRIDDDLKMKSDSLFKDLGMDTTTAIRIFLAQSVAHNGFPFEIKRVPEPASNPYAPLTEEQIYAKLENAEKQIGAAECLSAQEAISRLRKKYDL